MNRECTCWVNYPNESHRFKNGRCKCVDYYENVYTGIESNYRATTKCRMKDGFGKFGKEIADD